MTHSDHKIRFAQRLRRNMTRAETVLRNAVRNRRCNNLKFRRQVPIAWYVVDFLCMEKSLVVEVDGGIHNDQKQYDSEREEDLQNKGYKILRFTKRTSSPRLASRINHHQRSSPLLARRTGWKERGRACLPVGRGEVH